MKKVLIVLLVFLMAGCTPKIEGYDDHEKYRTPNDWVAKSGTYGDYFTDFKSVILVDDLDEASIEKYLYKAKISLNFYDSQEFSPYDQYEIIEIKDEPSFIKFTIDRKKENYRYIKGKLFKDELKSVSLICKQEDDEDGLYEKIFP